RLWLATLPLQGRVDGVCRSLLFRSQQLAGRRASMNEHQKFPAGTAFGSIGQPIRRKEDARLLTGKGRFTDDFSVEGQAYAAMVRSPHPHARIVKIETAAAETMPG